MKKKYAVSDCSVKVALLLPYTVVEDGKITKKGKCKDKLTGCKWPYWHRIDEEDVT